MTTALALLRRWVVDYFNSHDTGAAREFVAPDYTLYIGDVVFSGRDTSWLPAVDQQFQAFPGMGMTVHQTLAGDGWAAIWFSEHGASDGRVAAWSGVGIYRSDGAVLTGCVAQEDYMTRRRQLKSGVADVIDRPAPAPWDTQMQSANPVAESAVRDWLNGNWPRPQGDVHCDDDHITGTFCPRAITSRSTFANAEHFLMDYQHPPPGPPQKPSIATASFWCATVKSFLAVSFVTAWACGRD
jgi:hypothetical protein